MGSFQSIHGLSGGSLLLNPLAVNLGQTAVLVAQHREQAGVRFQACIPRRLMVLRCRYRDGA
jgi:hypothetical protein